MSSAFRSLRTKKLLKSVHFRLELYKNILVWRFFLRRSVETLYSRGVFREVIIVFWGVGFWGVNMLRQHDDDSYNFRKPRVLISGTLSQTVNAAIRGRIARRQFKTSKMRPVVTDVPWSVCVCLLDVTMSCSETDRDAVWGVHLGGPNEPCIRRGPGSLHRGMGSSPPPINCMDHLGDGDSICNLV